MLMHEKDMASIREYRHRMRLAGRWGACFEVACFVEYQFGWKRRDGVYQLADGTPVFKHAWNETPDGWIVDGTADQFFHGGDIETIAPGSASHGLYRETYTIAHNPAMTPWLRERPWPGEPDDSFWNRLYREKRLGPGWWLADVDARTAYASWLSAGAETYPLFRAKLEEYRALGYAI